MFFKPSPKQGAHTTEVKIPHPHSFHRMIRKADVTVITGPFGRILQQAEKGAQYLLTKHCFEVDEAGGLEMSADKPAIVLTYTLEGMLPMQHSLLGKLDHREGTGFLYYLPAGGHTIQFPPGHCTVLKLHINLDLLELVCYEHPEMDELLAFARDGGLGNWELRNVKSNKRTRTLIASITQCRKKGGLRLLFIDQSVQQLLEEYIHVYKKKPKNYRGYKVYEEHRERLKHATDTMNELELLALSVKELALITNIPLRNMMATSKELFQMGPKAYLSKRKIKAACRLLLTTDMSISVIAFKTAFADSSSFCREFKKNIGCQPEEYRKDKVL